MLRNYTLEDLLAIKKPVRIPNLSNGARKTLLICPPSEIKRQLKKAKDEIGLNESTSPIVTLRDYDSSLYRRLCAWGAVLGADKKPTQNVSRALEFFGWNLTPRVKLSVDEAKEIILEVITKEYVQSVLAGKDVPAIRPLMKQKGPLAFRAYRSSLSGGRSNFDFATIINEHYERLVSDEPFSAYEAIKRNFLSTKKISQLANQWYYEGFSLNQKKILNLPLGKEFNATVKYHLKKTTKRHNNGSLSNNGDENPYMNFFCTLLDYKRAKPSDVILDSRAAVKKIGHIFESEFHLSLAAMKVLGDTSLFPEFEAISGSKIYELVPENNTKKVTLQGSKRMADGRVKTTNGLIMLEMKKGDVIPRRMLNGLRHYTQKNSFSDGVTIDHKVLVVDSANGDLPTIKKGAEEIGFTTISGKEFTAAYERIVNKIFAEGLLDNTMPFNTKDNLINLRNMMFKEPHLLWTRPHRYLRTIVHEILKKNTAFLLGQEAFEGYKPVDFVHEFLLSEFGDGEYDPAKSKQFPTNVAIIDFETTGFLGTGSSIVAFGIARRVGDDFLASIITPRSPMEEEEAFLHAHTILKDYDTIIYFNGKKFDKHVYEERCFAHRIKPLEFKQFIDLYFEFMLKKKKKYEKATLQTYERQKNHLRINDIPGRDIPKAYDDFQLGLGSDNMLSIINHNVMDVFTPRDMFFDYLTMIDQNVPLFAQELKEQFKYD